MMTQAAAAIVWFAGLAGWYIIRHPFARRAKKIEVRASFYDHREIFFFSPSRRSDCL